VGAAPAVAVALRADYRCHRLRYLRLNDVIEGHPHLAVVGQDLDLGRDGGLVDRYQLIGSVAKHRLLAGRSIRGQADLGVLGEVGLVLVGDAVEVVSYRVLWGFCSRMHVLPRS